jgi:hypothetical protein
MNSSILTHKDLVGIAYNWVLKNTRCGVAFRELVTCNNVGECPDVIGFGYFGFSILIECKISRSDFCKDKNKRFRKMPRYGMGSQRFYCCPTGLLKVEDLPDGWGLIYVSENGKARCIHNPYKGKITERHEELEKNIKAEHELMYSALRRLEIKGHIEEVYSQPTGGLSYGTHFNK